MGMYVLSLGGLMIILMRIVFYGRLMVVTILIVMPNGNAHYYYNSLVMRVAVVGGSRIINLGVLTVAIVIIILIF